MRVLQEGLGEVGSSEIQNREKLMLSNKCTDVELGERRGHEKNRIW